MAVIQKLKSAFSIQIGFVFLFQIIGFTLGILTLAGFLGQFWWFLDLTSHFRVQYAGILIAVALVMLLKKQWKWSGTFLVFCLINVSEFAGLYNERQPFSESLVSPFRVMLLNVQTQNKKFQEVKSYIFEVDPDLVVLEEINNRWSNELESLESVYPFKVSESREDNFGIVMFSKYELNQSEVMYFGEAGVPSVYAEFKIEGREVALLGTHPPPPGSKEYSMFRNGQLEEIALFVNEVDIPLILIGDLNLTPWNHYFKRLVNQTGLENSAKGQGLQMSWPTIFPLPMRIQIDHCLN